MVEAQSVWKIYRTGSLKVEALRGLDLKVRKGEMVAVMGPSGCGKTTLLNCLSGLDDIDAGTVLVEGEDIHAMSDARRTEHRSRHMGFIFQSFNLIPVFTAVENVELPLLLGGAKAGQARAGAAEMLDRVGLGNRLDHRPGELSGGEQQRVAVARALAQRPKLLLADEPTGNLDPATGEDVQQLMFELNQEHGAALVVATHNDRLAAAMGRTLRLAGGALHELGSGSRGRAHGMTS